MILQIRGVNSRFGGSGGEVFETPGDDGGVDRPTREPLATVVPRRGIPMPRGCACQCGRDVRGSRQARSLPLLACHIGQQPVQEVTVPKSHIVDFPLSAQSDRILAKELARIRRQLSRLRKQEQLMLAEIRRRPEMKQLVPNVLKKKRTYSLETRLYRAYRRQQCSARERGIEWKLSYEEWLDIWKKSGHFKERGRYRGRWVMARKRDIGDYVVGNVEIVPWEENSAAAARFRNASYWGVLA